MKELCKSSAERRCRRHAEVRRSAPLVRKIVFMPLVLRAELDITRTKLLAMCRDSWLLLLDFHTSPLANYTCATMQTGPCVLKKKQNNFLFIYNDSSIVNVLNVQCDDITAIDVCLHSIINLITIIASDIKFRTSPADPSRSKEVCYIVIKIRRGILLHCIILINRNK